MIVIVAAAAKGDAGDRDLWRGGADDAGACDRVAGRPEVSDGAVQPAGTVTRIAPFDMPPVAAV